MGNYVLTTVDDAYVLEDPVSGHRYTAWRHAGHLHGEEVLPWSMDGAGRTSPEDLRDYYVAVVRANGHTVNGT